MNLQVIKSIDGKAEYVLLPIHIYHALHHRIEGCLKKAENNPEYLPFDLTDYVENPIALARIRAEITQAELAERMQVSQAYISKIERQDTVTAKLLSRVKKALCKQ